MIIIELFEDFAKVLVNGKEFDIAIHQPSQEIILDINFLREFKNFDDMNECDECEQGWYDDGEGDESYCERRKQQLDTCERGSRRLWSAYLQVLTQIKLKL